MITRSVDPEIIRGLIKARDELDFWLMEQGGLTAREAPKLWQAAQLLGSYRRREAANRLCRRADFDLAASVLAIAFHPNG